MQAGASISRGNAGRESSPERPAGAEGAANGFAGLAMRLPERVLASAGAKCGEYDARRLRSQREIIRDVMLAAADCDTWLTLAELRAVTRYGEASISAQLRHLRKGENGGYDVAKRHREGATATPTGSDGRGECVWEYRMDRGIGVTGRAGSGDGDDGAALGRV